MTREHISIELKRAHDDPPVDDPEFQDELGEFAKLLGLLGVAYSQQGAAGYSTLEFLVTLSPEIGSTFAMVLMGWFQRRVGRSIRLTMFDDDVDLQTVEDFEGFVVNFKRIQDHQGPKREEGS
jgi:hypothetical protein